jgi:hypothetical protein
MDTLVHLHLEQVRTQWAPDLPRATQEVLGPVSSGGENQYRIPVALLSLLAIVSFLFGEVFHYVALRGLEPAYGHRNAPPCPALATVLVSGGAAFLLRPQGRVWPRGRAKAVDWAAWLRPATSWDCVSLETFLVLTCK